MSTALESIEKTHFQTNNFFLIYIFQRHNTNIQGYKYSLWKYSYTEGTYQKHTAVKICGISYSFQREDECVICVMLQFHEPNNICHNLEDSWRRKSITYACTVFASFSLNLWNCKFTSPLLTFYSRQTTSELLFSHKSGCVQKHHETMAVPLPHLHLGLVEGVLWFLLVIQCMLHYHTGTSQSNKLVVQSFILSGDGEAVQEEVGDAELVTFNINTEHTFHSPGPPSKAEQTLVPALTSMGTLRSQGNSHFKIKDLGNGSRTILSHADRRCCSPHGKVYLNCKGILLLLIAFKADFS